MHARRLSALILALLVSLGAAGCSRRPARFEEPPDILLVMVDTLRADHLSAYGYDRNTSPQIHERFAKGGVIFDNAYAPASWTAPSVAAILTGREPSDLVREVDLRGFGIPPEEPTLAERFREAGYETAAFVGNVLVNPIKGFAKGFDHFWLPPDGVASIAYPAETVLDPALAWIGARADRGRPLFLYVHFMDPHAPYSSPDLVDGRSEFYPDYAGKLGGDDVHWAAIGALPPSDDPESDVRQLRALYDSEVKYVDRAVGALIDATESVSRRRTLVVFLADHGEELDDHGGWSHGRTVYEEQIRVPLAFRASGLVDGGRRVAANVEVLGVGRTLLAAAGVREDLGMRGENLLPVILGETPAPARRPILVRHWHRGPIRAALIVDRRRTLLFNSRQRFRPVANMERAYHESELRRLHRFASFDLESDPGQLQPLPPTAEEIEAAYALLDPTLDGVRVLLRGVKEGQTVTGSLHFELPPSGTMPYFLDGADRVAVHGRAVRFRLVGEKPPKGFLVLGDVGSLESVTIRPASRRFRVSVGAGAPWTGTPVAETDLRRASWPAWSGRPGLRIWSRERRPLAADRPLDDETRARLRALGYL
jgi:arylsulfatase A-like enzyme